MRPLVAIICATLLSISSSHASDNLIGLWASGAKELLSISKDGDKMQAEFIRVNVKSEFERVRFPAEFKDGAVVISSEQGNVSGRYDDNKKVLVLGGFKSFQKLTESEALVLIEALEKKK